MTAHLIRKLELRDELSEEEKELLTSSIRHSRTIREGEEIVRQGDRPAVSTVLLEGFTARTQHVGEGARSITSIHVPGDFVDLHAFLIKKMDHGVTALTDCRVATVSHSDLQRITETAPHLTRMLWLTTLIDGAIHRRWLAAMGRQNAVSHMAHLFCELYLRQAEVLRLPDYKFLVPLSQAALGDAMGLSAVHVNRTLKQLRQSGTLEWTGREATILDWDGLRTLADFDPTYLHLEHEPR